MACTRKDVSDLHCIQPSKHCRILTWTSVARGTIIRGIVATKAGILLVALEHSVTLVRGAIVASVET